ncbi:MAG: peptidylprolyl isomerase [Erysipelotrichaceae bacterium]|nr:peptidylprolyl isomerase [Erysipelotrichaceae bacterium]
MTNLIKKYWFVSLVVIFLFVIIIYFVYDTNKDTLSGKKVDGNDVVYTINKIDKTADELYTDLYDKYGIATIYNKLEQAVANQAIETTEEMETIAKENSQTIISNFESQYGDTYEEQLLSALKQVGYSKVDDLETYLIQIQKITLLFENYLNDNPELVQTYIDEKSPRIVSHILISMEDPNNPTQEELDIVKKVEEELEAGEDFGVVAYNYSDDTASAQLNGSLGYATKDTQFVPEFLEAMLLLEENEVSDWVKTNYGYHLIKVDSTSLKELELVDDFYTDIYSYYPNMQSEAIWEKANELGIDFKGNKELEIKLKKYLGISE